MLDRRLADLTDAEREALEIDLSAARLDWYKVQGCFTEIIRY